MDVCINMGVNFFKRKLHVIQKPHVKLVVTGVSSDVELRKLEKECKEKGIDVVATSLPVLGVFDLSDYGVGKQ